MQTPTLPSSAETTSYNHMHRHQASSSFRFAMACSREGGSLCTDCFGSPPCPEAAAAASRASRSARRLLAEVKSGAGKLKKTQGYTSVMIKVLRLTGTQAATALRMPVVRHCRPIWYAANGQSRPTLEAHHSSTQTLPLARIGNPCPDCH